MQMQLGYKVVRKAGNSLISITGGGTSRACTYAIGAVTKPKPGLGSLAVFTDKTSACVWGSGKNYEVYLCAYIPNLNGRLFDGCETIPSCMCPLNTAFASAVTLIHKIPKEERKS